MVNKIFNEIRENSFKNTSEDNKKKIANEIFEEINNLYENIKNNEQNGNYQYHFYFRKMAYLSEELDFIIKPNHSKTMIENRKFDTNPFYYNLHVVEELMKIYYLWLKNNHSEYMK